MKSRALAPIAVSIATAAVVAAALVLFTPHWLPPMVRVVAVYDAAALALLACHWVVALRTNVSATRAHAAAQDPGRDAVFVVTLTAAVFGFVAALDMLGRGPRDRTPEHEAIVYTLGFGAVILGWLLIHTIFLFRYAHLYYGDRDRNKESDRGLTFPGGADPNYLDFAYFSFVIGMTFQVSDVQITDRIIRRLALGHAMISFGYNTAILALVVNIVSGLLH